MKCYRYSFVGHRRCYKHVQSILGLTHPLAKRQYPPAFLLTLMLNDDLDDLLPTDIYNPSSEIPDIPV